MEDTSLDEESQAAIRTIMRADSFDYDVRMTPALSFTQMPTLTPSHSSSLPLSSIYWLQHRSAALSSSSCLASKRSANAWRSCAPCPTRRSYLYMPT